MRSELSERVSLSSPFCYFHKKLRFNLRLQVETQLFHKKFYRFSDYLFKSPQMLERLGISSISGILRFGRYPAYHGISEPHLALKSSKTVVETAAYYYAASLSIAAFAEA